MKLISMILLASLIGTPFAQETAQAATGQTGNTGKVEDKKEAAGPSTQVDVRIQLEKTSLILNRSLQQDGRLVDVPLDGGVLKVAKGAKFTFEFAAPNPKDLIVVEWYEDVEGKQVRQDVFLRLSSVAPTGSIDIGNKSGHFVVKSSGEGSRPFNIRFSVPNVPEQRKARFVSTLGLGAMFTQNFRSTYSLTPALDSSGNQIPGRNQIIQTRNDRNFSSGFSGKVHYVFGDQQKNGLIKTLQEVGSLGLHVPGSTSFGLFLGIAGTPDKPLDSYQVGFSFFPDSEERFAISYGINFAQTEQLRQFKAGDIVSLTDLNSVVRKTWSTGWFISLSYKL